jgi:iron(III) transport system substrate-binding protein
MDEERQKAAGAPTASAASREEGETMRTGLLSLLLALASALWPAAGTVRAQDTESAIYAAARNEGKVVVWTPLDMDLYRQIAAKFAERYPGIQIEPFRIQPGPAVERLVTEMRAGRISVDAVDPNIAYFPILFERGLVEPFAWDKVFGIDPQRLLFDKRAVVIGHYDLPIGYNTSLVKPGEIKSWDDVLDPKWRGKVLLETRGSGLGVLTAKWGEDNTVAYVRKLMENRPIITKGAQGTAEALAGGQGAIAIGAYAARLTLFKEAGAPVDWARVGPIPAQLVAIAPIKGGQHPNAAKLLAAFWASPDAQKIFYDNQRYGMVGYYMSPRGEELRKNAIEVILETTDIERGRRWTEAVGRTIGGIK